MLNLNMEAEKLRWTSWYENVMISLISKLCRPPFLWCAKNLPQYAYTFKLTHHYEAYLLDDPSIQPRECYYVRCAC